MSSPISRILWAVDPFQREPRLVATAAKALHAFAGDRNGTIGVEPAYVLRSDFPSPAGIPAALSVVEETARDQLNASLRKKPDFNLLPLKLLDGRGFSNSGAVDILLDYARSEKKELIVICSHGRKGLRRLLLGSFAESLLLRSEIPVLLANPGTRIPAHPQRLLFPTDFTEASREVFADVLSVAESRDWEIVLHHKISPTSEYPHPPNWLLHPWDGALPKRERKTAHAELDALAREASERGVRTQVMLDGSDYTVAESITRHARLHSAIIAMAAHSGSRLGWVGSVTRRVARESALPVWVIHPRIKASSAPVTRSGPVAEQPETERVA